ncbi:anti-sigma factor family protein [Rhodococcus spongiicola]|uniref:Zf-HC2 domain-containing protein n=1 Tax=Rhodococcus spongiicola TaxID=2487352 RepID=A0A3S3CPF8_9NOCA|nr:zf-HC2 domain-containing protein [Rhodococcus spongiicola]RVW02478.1 zf-HC2 domain-containing protein [Rhodococcus spongiicola]
MIQSVRTMLTCHWAARRIQRYLDSDPAALLDQNEIRRLEAHLAECEKCSAAAAEYRQINTALSRWAARRMPQKDSVAHMRRVVDRLVRGDIQ